MVRLSALADWRAGLALGENKGECMASYNASEPRCKGDASAAPWLPERDVASGERIEVADELRRAGVFGSGDLGMFTSTSDGGDNICIVMGSPTTQPSTMVSSIPRTCAVIEGDSVQEDREAILFSSEQTSVLFSCASRSAADIMSCSLITAALVICGDPATSSGALFR